MKSELEIVTGLYSRVYHRPPKKITPVKGGLSNDIFLCDGSIVRIKLQSDFAFYDAASEYLNLKAASAANLAPAIRYFDLSTGNLVYPFVKGKVSWAGPKLSPLQLRKIGVYIAKMHTLDGGKGQFKASKRFDYYKESSGRFLANKEQESNIRSIVEKIISDEPLCYSHNDLVKGNIVALQTGGFRFLDYEFSGLNNEMFDLASFLSENQIDSQFEEEQLLKGYFGGRYEPLLLRKCRLFMLYEDHLWLYWAISRYEETKNKAFLSIAEDKRKAMHRHG